MSSGGESEETLPPSSAAQSRDTMRQAGREYFNKIMTNVGEADLTVQASSKRRDALDSDFLAVGAVIEGSKLYIILGACILCRACGILFLKESMEHLETPAFLVFCHQLALASLLWTLSSQGILSIPSISTSDLQAAIPAAIFESVLMILFFASLNLGSVLFVVTFTAVAMATVPALMPSAGSQTAPGSSLSSQQTTALSFAAAGCGLELLMHRAQGTATWVYLLLWLSALYSRCLWTSLGESPAASKPFLSSLGVPDESVQALSKVAAASAALGLPTHARSALVHSLSCLPVLVLGFLFQEGPELLEHDLSVPSLTVMVCSVACFAAGESCRLVLQRSFTVTANAGLEAAFLIALALFSCIVRPRVTGLLSVLGVLLVASGTFVMRRTSEAAPPGTSRLSV